jgi:hypothetical protein
LVLPFGVWVGLRIAITLALALALGSGGTRKLTPHSLLRASGMG